MGSKNLSQTKKVLAYDLGGTKVAVGVVSAKGDIIEERREPIRLKAGKTAVIRQLSDYGREYLKKYPEIRLAGVASAGPLHPERGSLLDPTNFGKGAKRWGEVPLAHLMEKKLGIPVALENDAAAAMLAEHWIGAARTSRNAMILTLGTGLGTGIIANGKLVRAGRGLHTEAGHIILKANDPTAKCGCGNLGCAEAYLSGNGFARWVKENRWIKSGTSPLEAREIADLARRGHVGARHAFHEMAELLAVAIHNYVVVFCPEVIVLTGSFAAASDVFLPHAKKRTAQLLKRRREGIDLLPEIRLSALDNRAGLLGGAWIALHSGGRL
jgi:glucokinase